ncbi:unnamed protein product [Prorocentrum cordatum]|uniref:PROP1-like PPR domain-containing protein n=1 Tax=Prorocentrum cordatum TaxID=2364126 RepID=A0ABN9PQT0_9DINO|nr:unnamed protein product [Polarella glacialis]
MTPRPCTYNALLAVCIQCGDPSAAVRTFKEAVESNMADVVTYNTMIKCLTQHGKLAKARAVMTSMYAIGLHPNVVTYNELIDANVKQQNSRAVWELVDEMQSNKVAPSTITVSILLKTLDRKASSAEFHKVMTAVACVENQMDEVLFSSLLEACIRAGRKDILQTQLQRHRGSDRRIEVTGIHTFGSLFRAYGQVGDTDGLWKEWKLMRSLNLMPTQITFGCMVEAVAINGDPHSALELIREMWNDSDTSHLVNAVVYCSVVRSYSQQKEFALVWEVYEEMRSRKVVCSNANFNALFDACARSGEMERAPAILEEMKRQGIDANLITWSTLLKGYCQANQLDRAFDILDHMQDSCGLEPDEVVYNTLLDGCARQGMLERGLELFERMQASSTQPSCYTLSVLVKLANRGGDLDLCFHLVESTTRKYDMRPNTYVYNNLMQACMQHRAAARGMEVFEAMLGQTVRPDARTYCVMLRGLVGARMVEDATGLARCAWGIPTDHPVISGNHGGVAVLKARRSELPAELATEVVEGLARVSGAEATALALLDELEEFQGIRFDPKLRSRLTSKAARSSESARR